MTDLDPFLASLNVWASNILIVRMLKKVTSSN